MKFDLFGIIMMIVAVALGQFVGAYLNGYLGSLASGIVGTLIIGLVCYVIYTFMTGGKFGMVGAVAFAVLIYVANLIAGYAGGMIGIGGGILTLVITGFVASLLWGFIGGRVGARKGKGLKLK